jgi:muramoyltetrapeptide carboxypeptidase
MNRKHFLSSVIALGAAVPVLANDDHNDEAGHQTTRVPAALKHGDTIGITCPAGFITLKEIQPAIQLIESWGFKVKVGETVGKKEFTFGGTDEERLADFQYLMNDRSVKAILCARGGYGSIRIIDRLNFSTFNLHPKWIIGFSDITVMHCHLYRNYGIASIHSKMCNSFPDDWATADIQQQQTILSIKQALSGEKMKYEILTNENNRIGKAEGVLIGGNLKTIESLAGSRSDIHTQGCILFVEDTGEYLYSIDRMFWNLARTGKLSGLAGLIIGGFKVKPDDPGEEFGKTVADIVLEKVKKYKYPVCFDFPVGHQKNNVALKCGVYHKLVVEKDKAGLQEFKAKN